MSVMSKRILVNLPAKLLQSLKALAKSEYKSVSGIIRESIVDRLNDEFTANERNIIRKGQAEYREGKGVNWRSIKRG
jgi:metal-responsive CopG/Arc/MetJ family transcriptional regulator